MWSTCTQKYGRVKNMQDCLYAWHVKHGLIYRFLTWSPRNRLYKFCFSPAEDLCLLLKPLIITQLSSSIKRFMSLNFPAQNISTEEMGHLFHVDITPALWFLSSSVYLGHDNSTFERRGIKKSRYQVHQAPLQYLVLLLLPIDLMTWKGNYPAVSFPYVKNQQPSNLSKPKVTARTTALPGNL